MKKQKKQFWVGVFVGATLVLLMMIVANEIKQSEVPLAFKQQGVTIGWLPNTVKQFEKEIEKQSRQYNLDANLVAILMTLESGGYTKADSGYARGLMQVTPATAGDIAKTHLKKPIKNYDLFNPETSIEFGAAYLSYLRDTLCSDQPSADSTDCTELLAAGYNGGPGAAIELSEGNGVKADETLFYSRNVREMWRERQATKGLTYERWLEAGGGILIDKAEKQLES